jgi:MarR family transcriptional regulator, organic hydroperoxide resistance regulator
VSELVATFTRASKLMRASADAAMSRHGVRVGQNLVLEALWHQDGQTPGQLAERLSLRTPTLVKMANRMEAVGLIERQPEPTDRRLVRLHLTEKGRSLQSAIEDEIRQLDARATARLTPEEREQLQAALGKVIEALQPTAGDLGDPAEDAAVDDDP